MGLEGTSGDHPNKPSGQDGLPGSGDTGTRPDGFGMSPGLLCSSQVREI